MTYKYRPVGVCSREMEVELDGDIIKSVHIRGGCDGNLQGICRLVENMNAKEAIQKISGIRCGYKSTSCPDQLSIALQKALDSDADA